MTSFWVTAQTCVDLGTPGNQRQVGGVNLSIDRFGNLVSPLNGGKPQIVIAGRPEEQSSATLEIIGQACDAVEIRSKQRKSGFEVEYGSPRGLERGLKKPLKKRSERHRFEPEAMAADGRRTITDRGDSSDRRERGRRPRR